MEQNNRKVPKIFISYRWTNPDHESWVVELATRLVEDGIVVILDKWDLLEGHDTYVFMEQMAKSNSDIDKVLVICDKGYQESADNRAGGVGSEAQIITQEIYNKTTQEKYIPIIAERDEDLNAYIPIYMKSRLYIDLSDSDKFEENYEKLLRNLYSVPLYRKPQIGKPPAFILEEEMMRFETSKILRKIRSALDKSPNRLHYFWQEFTDTFVEDFKKIRVSPDIKSSDYDQFLVDILDIANQLKNDYIEALEIMFSCNALEVEDLVLFFESIASFTENDGSNSSVKWWTEHYKFIVQECFLYCATLLNRLRNYDLLIQLLRAEFHIDRKSQPLRFNDFRFYLETLEDRNKRLNLNKVSLHANLLKDRAPSKLIKDLLATDLLLYYISKLSSENLYSIWFPTTYIFAFNLSLPIKTLMNLKSKSHFSKIKNLLYVENPDELKSKIQNFQVDRGYNGALSRIPHIRTFISEDEVCTSP